MQVELWSFPRKVRARHFTWRVGARRQYFYPPYKFLWQQTTWTILLDNDLDFLSPFKPNSIRLGPLTRFNFSHTTYSLALVCTPSLSTGRLKLLPSFQKGGLYRTSVFRGELLGKRESPFSGGLHFLHKK